MKHYLSIAYGGMKISAILFDENLKRQRICVTSSVHANTAEKVLLWKHTQELIRSLGLAGLSVEEYGGVCDGRLIHAVGSVCELKRQGISGELDVGLVAVDIFCSGLLALCGTGVTMNACVREK